MRERLPNRRESTILEVWHANHRHHVSYSLGTNGRIAEVFAHGPKAGSEADSILASACASISISLQHGVPLEELASATERLEDNQPADIIGRILVTLLKEQTHEQ